MTTVNRGLATVIGLAFATACSGPSPTTDGPALTTTSLSSFRPDPIAFLPGFDVGYLRVGEQEWTVAVADTPELRGRGLQGVENLSWIDGVLFEWEADVSEGFSMFGVVIPFDIAWISEDGLLIEVVSMLPCLESSCPNHVPSSPFRYALAARPGAFDGVADTVPPFGGLPPITVSEISGG